MALAPWQIIRIENGWCLFDGVGPPSTSHASSSDPQTLGRILAIREALERAQWADEFDGQYDGCSICGAAESKGFHEPWCSTGRALLNCSPCVGECYLHGLRDAQGRPRGTNCPDCHGRMP